MRAIKRSQLSERLIELTFESPHLSTPAGVRLLLPSGYEQDAPRRYPVLYLLHGGLDDYRAWTEQGGAEEVTEGSALIVVMPEASIGGWYTDWFNAGRGGPPRWESFHIGELIPWIDTTFPTVSARRGRAVAGLSMGGFGAMSYAGRHPGLFAAAVSFSGVLDTNDPQVHPTIGRSAKFHGRPRDAIFGARDVHEAIWREHNPWDLAANLRGLRLALYCGDGRAGPLDGGGDAQSTTLSAETDPTEAAVYAMTVSFHERLVALGIDHAWHDYGSGRHNWAYWNRDLRHVLPFLMSTLR